MKLSIALRVPLVLASITAASPLITTEHVNVKRSDCATLCDPLASAPDVAAICVFTCMTSGGNNDAVISAAAEEARRFIVV
ncbi:hypothetical protein QBC34DRAFT_386624 [Podospora aff. communis PSN243]|uniref:Uncharacterized protein n=1 Tax=Podospora aff. communis PSN243 TaxID=3040156 RepID=A0AAV9G528_9PEZI|nr:hypothetical protein QBC34DRAFT_386624 [Podospora aff. communis PSN243]